MYQNLVYHGSNLHTGWEWEKQRTTPAKCQHQITASTEYTNLQNIIKHAEKDAPRVHD